MADQNNISEQRPEAWLFNEALRAKREMLLAVSFAFAGGLLLVGQARLLATACQRMVVDQLTVNAILPLAAAVAVVAIVRGILSFCSERYAIKAAALVKHQVRCQLHSHLLDLVPTGLVNAETGTLVEALTSGIEGLEPYIARFLPQVVLAAVLPVTILCIALPVEWRSGLLLLFSAPFIPLFMVLIGRGSEKLNRSQWDKLSRMAGHLLDLIQGLPDLKIFGAAKREAAVVARVSEEYRHSTMAVLRIAFLSAFTLEFFTTVGTAVVAVVIGFQLLGRQLALVDGLFILLLAPEFYLPFRTLGLSYHARMQGIATAEKLAPLLAMQVPTGNNGEQTPPIINVEIVFEDVSYRYGGERGGLSGISLKFSAGNLTALAGESGSGKSTVARLVAGLVQPESGRILINGIDLDRIDPDHWRAQLVWVAQTPFFFKGSIRDNLLLGLEETPEEEINSALEDAAADLFIKQLPKGIDTQLGDRGAGLSGGELRRLALARAFLRKGAVVILDEPSSGLDAENERLVGEAIKRLAVNRTVLLISHREETLRLAQMLAVLAEGRLERLVTPDEYLAPLAGLS
jgi:ATP-binding cassette subfamily C protein CydD